MTSCVPSALTQSASMGMEIGWGNGSFENRHPLCHTALCVSCALRHRRMFEKTGRTKLWRSQGSQIDASVSSACRALPFLHHQPIPLHPSLTIQGGVLHRLLLWASLCCLLPGRSGERKRSPGFPPCSLISGSCCFLLPSRLQSHWTPVTSLPPSPTEVGQAVGCCPSESLDVS